MGINRHVIAHIDTLGHPAKKVRRWDYNGLSTPLAWRLRAQQVANAAQTPGLEDAHLPKITHLRAEDTPRPGSTAAGQTMLSK